jgi:prepilin-type N-terminal cleavage/methylation domain-containing protein
MKKNIFSKKDKSLAGFTLIELLVAVTIFSIIISAILAGFISAITTQRKILAYQELFDQISYVVEYMSRNLRMAKKERGIGCLSSKGLNYELVDNNSIKFIRVIREEEGGTVSFCEKFYMKNKQIKDNIEKIGIDLPLTSEDLEVRKFVFKRTGDFSLEDPTHLFSQPRVTSAIEIKTKDNQIIKLQFTISQRAFDVNEEQ